MKNADPTVILMILIAVALATGAIFIYLLFIWWLDRYEREPIWLVGITFIWGALGGTCLSCFFNSTIGSAAVGIVGAQAAKVFTTVVVAPTIEEFMKALIFVPLLLIGNNIDNRTDGLIYGAATGLGFACLENLWYYMNNVGKGAEALFAIIVMRTLFTALIHCTSSAMLGMAIGYARHRSGALRWVLWPLLGYLCAVTNHAVWNGIATVSGVLGKAGSIAILGGVLIIIFVSLVLFILTQMSLHAEHKFITHYLEEEAKRGVIPMEHATIIPYWLKRRKKDWLPPHVDKGEYIKAATLLAFRHHQLEIAQGERRERYLEEIALYRQRVNQLLRGA